MELPHALTDGSSEGLFALEFLRVAIGTPARDNPSTEVWADAPQRPLRVPRGLSDPAERWRWNAVLADEGVDPLPNGRVIVAVAGCTRPFCRRSSPRGCDCHLVWPRHAGRQYVQGRHAKAATESK